MQDVKEVCSLYWLCQLTVEAKGSQATDAAHAIGKSHGLTAREVNTSKAIHNMWLLGRNLQAIFRTIGRVQEAISKTRPCCISRLIACGCGFVLLSFFPIIAMQVSCAMSHQLLAALGARAGP